MTTHLTNSGAVELIREWGHGRGEPLWNRAATIVCDDGDGHYDAWSYTGARADAVATLAPLMVSRKSDAVVMQDGHRLTVESTESLRAGNFWIEDGDDFKPNVAAYPNAVAW